MPTVVTKIGDRYYAQINDLHSHANYSVIWNPKDFSDVKNHWAKEDINDIAARLDLAGTGNNTFSPNRNALVHGAMQEMQADGVIGIITGIFEVTSAGISAAIIFGFLGALVFKPKG
ncbi:SpoVA/SpoVAEb family sporulation membrane protein [Aneurinibacillus aneurinilyticus]|uniref:SpoVA/SpoVAEb family sporulation membrane protein n=1 Tax=Aneurinibacillus aneurinilyticus TaxID=1391 RepID=UPI00040D2387|nr:SpoVA/SpoVAEb family sporulation membrane protein [Aneurinibacillus aneurinilyticus]MED0709801.1 SpoVA/SpoVAEb family sporulation membrane protein [Aneurinibacillus aneurinilyticus]MED0726184.1 SpoVA/SpoVAEb family sporulation membrane protein [Aneurinibacillus aneurinilyticus]MED0733755.1 SpoVA/SpoVAEb family sporulation membrane protein [Aneurinibacillus aneurinilyticus]MED0741975.1 SpoVA/SpoVAEb family sporulation membrane protein [Aneurinibacillus aneurinilyticus]